MLKLLNFSCSRCSFPSDHSDHFLVNINPGERPDADLANSTLEDACALLAPGERPVIHSDRVLALI